MLGNDEFEEAKIKTKITALKWDEMTQQEKQLVISVNAPNLVDEALVAFENFIVNSGYYYFDRLGNIYTYNIEKEITF